MLFNLDKTSHSISEGYSIFVVTGVLPTSEADQLLSLVPYEPPPPPPPPYSLEGKAARVSKSPQDFDSLEDEDLAEAIALSLVGRYYDK